MTTPDPATIPDPLVEFFLEIAKDLGKSLWDNTIGRGKKEIDWKISARRYAGEITKQYGKIQVYGQARPAELLDIFTDVYLLEKPVALRRYDIDSLQAWFAERERRASLHQREERMPGLNALGRTDKLFILGKPGAGKTTFLKYLAVMAAGGSARLPYIPVFISLKAYADSGQDLLDFIARQFDICNFENAMPFIERMLKSGMALVLFDGLDEVGAGDGRRGDVIDELRDFSWKYDANKIVITCRVAATEYVFEGFEYVEMADFTPQQVERFITNWFGDEPTLGKQMLDELGKPENEGILELTQNPLLLTLLCIAYEETLAFPARRVEVYEDAVDALLRKWDTSRRIKRDEIYRKLSLGRKRQMLARIAYETFRQGDYFIPQRRLEKLIVDYLARVPEAPDEVDIDGEAVLKAIAAQHGLLVERSRRIYSFSHLTFQEYFTAKYIVDNEARGAVDELMQHAFDDRWREVFLLVVSMLASADDFFERFLKIQDNYALNNRLAKPLAWCERRRKQWIEQIKIVYDTIEQPIFCKPAAMRSLLLFLAFAYTNERFLDNLLAFAFAFACDLIHLSGRVRIFDQSRVRIFDVDRDRVRVRFFDRASSLSFARDGDRAHDFDLDIYFDHNRICFHIFESDSFTDRDFNFDLPDLYYKFDNELLDSITIFSNELTKYLQGAQLLIDCLDVAYVSDRRAIEDRLILPPQPQSPQISTNP